MYLEEVFPVITADLVYLWRVILSVKKTELTFSVLKALASVNQSLSRVLEGTRFPSLQLSGIFWTAFSSQGCQQAMHRAVRQDWCCSTVTTGAGWELKLAPRTDYYTTVDLQGCCQCLFKVVKVKLCRLEGQHICTYLLFLQIESVKKWMFAGKETREDC